MRDTYESINYARNQSGADYWACRSFECESCPASLDGKKPTERYEVPNCNLAMVLDLAERIKVVQESDTQEKIDADAMKSDDEYWDCERFECFNCPAEINGETPRERYGTPASCKPAQILDLLRRQRELLEAEND